jgi:hypothetical protein
VAEIVDFVPDGGQANTVTVMQAPAALDDLLRLAGAYEIGGSDDAKRLMGSSDWEYLVAALADAATDLLTTPAGFANLGISVRPGSPHVHS